MVALEDRMRVLRGTGGMVVDRERDSCRVKIYHYCKMTATREQAEIDVRHNNRR
jgi:hypothetical protein